jgi:hypothetical protein
MSLMTQSLLPPTPEDAELAAETGWPDVSRAIMRILYGHLLSIALFAELIILVVYVATQPAGKPSAKGPNQAQLRLEIMAIIGLAIFGFGQLWSIVMIIRGQWACLLRSPERCYAKWLMFGCILFILVSPTAGFFSGFLAATDAPPKKKAASDQETFTEVIRSFEDYKEQSHLATTSGLLQLASTVISLMSSFLFILYLRAVGRCWESDVCVILVDLYLVFVGILVVSAIALPIFAPTVLAQAMVIMALIGGAVLAFFWYLFLLFLVSMTISSGLANKKHALA